MLGEAQRRAYARVPFVRGEEPGLGGVLGGGGGVLPFVYYTLLSFALPQLPTHTSSLLRSSTRSLNRRLRGLQGC